MKFTVVSDTHLEFRKTKETVDLDIENKHEVTLILCGDIAVGFRAIETVIKAAVAEYKNVVYVSGNHDVYGTDYYSFVAAMRMLSDEIDNFYYLNCDVVEVEGVRIGGATLWGKVYAEYANRMADLHYIKPFKEDHTLINLFHEKEKAWVLEQDVDIMVTHMSPSPMLGNPVYPISRLTEYFSPDVIHDMKHKPKIWAFGHTHYSVDKVYAGVHCISNQVGYPDEYLKAKAKVYEIN